MGNDSVNRSIKSDDFEIQVRTVPGRTAVVTKAKLTPQKSLDLLISNQGDLIDPRMGSVELDAELGAVLAQQFQGLHSPDFDLDEVVKTSEKHIDVLGMQFNSGNKVTAKGSDMGKMSAHVNEHSEQDITDVTELVIPPNIVAHRMKMMQENDSSEESDILSIIEEEEELSESTEQTDEGKLTPSATSVLQTQVTTMDMLQNLTGISK